MKDTSLEMENIYFQKIMSFTQEERFLMAVDMFDTAKSLVIASLPKSLSKIEIKVQTFLRFYGNDFSEEEKEKIVNHLRRVNAISI
jgi:hypothetical protein